MEELKRNRLAFNKSYINNQIRRKLWRKKEEKNFKEALAAALIGALWL